MAVGIEKEGFMQLYTQGRSPNGMFSAMFTTKPGNIYRGTKVAIDIERTGEELAIAIKKCTGPNLNDFDIFTTKEFTPPAYGEAFPMDACELLQRMAGVNPYDAAYQSDAAQITAKMLKGFKLIGDKIDRSIEFQAAEIMQTGMLTLINKTGDTVYEIDFKPKATHFPTVSVPWATVATADPLGDLSGMCDVIRADGKITPNRTYMGGTALRNFLKNDEVQANLDNTRINIGEIAPEMENTGATFYGFIWVGAYRLEIWTYPETFDHPVTGVPTLYLDDEKVVVTSSNTRLDKTFAMVPLLVAPDPRVADLLPGRMSSANEGMDVTPNVYVTPNGKQIMGELESRPLLIPVQIDGFGCLDTGT